MMYNKNKKKEAQLRGVRNINDRYFGFDFKNGTRKKDVYVRGSYKGKRAMAQKA